MANWFREYQFMTLTHCTYDEYLDTPVMVIDRVLRIHSVVEDVKADKERKANGDPTAGLPRIT